MVKINKTEATALSENIELGCCYKVGAAPRREERQLRGEQRIEMRERVVKNNAVN